MSISNVVGIMGTATNMGGIYATAHLIDQPFYEGLSRMNRTAALASVEMSKHMQRSTDAWNNMGNTAIAAGAISAVAIGAVAMQYMAFDESLRNIQSITKESDGAISALSGRILTLATSIGKFSPDELVKAQYEIVSANYSIEESMTILNKTSVLASAGMGSVMDATKGVITVLKAYGMEVQSTEYITSIMQQAVKIGVFHLDDLSQNMKRSITNAAALGVDVKEVMMAYSALTLKGYTAENADMLIGQLMKSFENARPKLREWVKDVTQSEMSPVEYISKKGITGLVEDLIKSGRGKTAAEQTEQIAGMFLNARAVNAALGLSTVTNAGTPQEKNVYLQDVVPQFSPEKLAINQAYSAWQEQQKAQMYDWKKTVVELQVAAIRLGEALKPTVDAFMRIFNFVIGLIKGNEKWIAGILSSTTAMSLLLGVTIKVVNMFKGLAAGFTNILPDLAARTMARAESKSAYGEGYFASIRSKFNEITSAHRVNLQLQKTNTLKNIAELDAAESTQIAKAEERRVAQEQREFTRQQKKEIRILKTVDMEMTRIATVEERELASNNRREASAELMFNRQMARDRQLMLSAQEAALKADQRDLAKARSNVRSMRSEYGITTRGLEANSDVRRDRIANNTDILRRTDPSDIAARNELIHKNTVDQIAIEKNDRQIKRLTTDLATERARVQDLRGSVYNAERRMPTAVTNNARLTTAEDTAYSTNQNTRNADEQALHNRNSIDRNARQAGMDSVKNRTFFPTAPALDAETTAVNASTAAKRKALNEEMALIAARERGMVISVAQAQTELKLADTNLVEAQSKFRQAEASSISATQTRMAVGADVEKTMSSGAATLANTKSTASEIAQAEAEMDAVTVKYQDIRATELAAGAEYQKATANIKTANTEKILARETLVASNAQKIASGGFMAMLAMAAPMLILVAAVIALASAWKIVSDKIHSANIEAEKHLKIVQGTLDLLGKALELTNKDIEYTRQLREDYNKPGQSSNTKQVIEQTLSSRIDRLDQERIANGQTPINKTGNFDTDSKAYEAALGEKATKQGRGVYKQTANVELAAAKAALAKEQDDILNEKGWYWTGAVWANALTVTAAKGKIDNTVNEKYAKIDEAHAESLRAKKDAVEKAGSKAFWANTGEYIPQGSTGATLPQDGIGTDTEAEDKAKKARDEYKAAQQEKLKAAEEKLKLAMAKYGPGEQVDAAYEMIDRVNAKIMNDLTTGKYNDIHESDILAQQNSIISQISTKIKERYAGIMEGIDFMIVRGQDATKQMADYWVQIYNSLGKEGADHNSIVEAQKEVIKSSMAVVERRRVDREFNETTMAEANGVYGENKIASLQARAMTTGATLSDYIANNMPQDEIRNLNKEMAEIQRDIRQINKDQLSQLSNIDNHLKPVAEYFNNGGFKNLTRGMTYGQQWAVEGRRGR